MRFLWIYGTKKHADEKYLSRNYYFVQEGGFYSAEDADSLPIPEASEKQEGAFYVWTYNELKSVLDKKIPGNDNVCFLDLVCHYFNVKKEGNVSRSQVCYY